MGKTNWKAIAITFIILFSALLLFNIWSVSLVMDEEAKVNECYYDICSDTPQADYFEGVCTCYDYDSNNEYEVVRTKYMK